MDRAGHASIASRFIRRKVCPLSTSRRAPARPGRPVRVADLAADLGLSTATVSRALNGSPLVRPEIARRVQDHARRRGYVPNRLARSLAARTRTFVGFLVPDVRNLAYSIAAGTCARLLGDAGYQLILAITGDDPDREYEAVTGLAGAQAAGIIAAPSAGTGYGGLAALTDLPVVEFNRTAGLPGPGVFCDDRAAFAAATRHVLELGHSDVGYIGTTETVSNGRWRLEGVRQAHGEAGLTLDPARVRLAVPTEENGRAAALDLLGRPDRPTAILVGSSSMSIGVARALARSGFAVPADLSLIVYGDPQWTDLCVPPLTTVAVPYRAMAEVVADLVLRVIASERPVAGDRYGRHWLPAEFIVRSSTAPPPAGAARRPPTGGNETR